MTAILALRTTLFKSLIHSRVLVLSYGMDTY
jgi:hypothetical protein